MEGMRPSHVRSRPRGRLVDMPAAVGKGRPGQEPPDRITPLSSIPDPGEDRRRHGGGYGPQDRPGAEAGPDRHCPQRPVPLNPVEGSSCRGCRWTSGCSRVRTSWTTCWRSCWLALPLHAGPLLPLDDVPGGLRDAGAARPLGIFRPAHRPVGPLLSAVDHRHAQEPGVGATATASFIDRSASDRDTTASSLWLTCSGHTARVDIPESRREDSAMAFLGLAAQPGGEPPPLCCLPSRPSLDRW